MPAVVTDTIEVLKLGDIPPDLCPTGTPLRPLPFLGAIADPNCGPNASALTGPLRGAYTRPHAATVASSIVDPDSHPDASTDVNTDASSNAGTINHAHSGAHGVALTCTDVLADSRALA